MITAEFLRAVWGEPPFLALGEIRLLRSGAPLLDLGPVGHASSRQHWFEIGGFGPERAAQWALEQNEDGWDAYYGVLPRLSQGGKADDCVTDTRVLWADVDAKKVEGAEARPMVDLKAEAWRTINSFPIPYSILVDSGGGYHVYWLLQEPVPHADAEPVMRWIAKVLRGDNVQDRPRILRLPGSINWKRHPAAEARLLRFTDVRHRFVDFIGLMPIEPEPYHDDVPRERIRVENLPDWLNELIATGAPKGSRSEQCFKTAVWLFRYGRTVEEIKDIFRATPDGIGAKYAGKSLYDGERWLDYTLTAAERTA